MRRLLLAFAALTLAACNDNSLADSPPRIEVQPSEVLFDATLPGAQNTKTATVKNRGGGVLVIDSMEIGGATPADFDFAIDGAFPVSLAPGEWFAVQVTFAPGATGDHSGILSVFSNDRAEPQVDVPLMTATLAGDIDATPNPLAFGTVTVGNPSTQPITVTNVGSAPLTVTGAAIGAGSSAEFTLPANPAFPVTLQPGDATSIPVRYAPTAATAASGTVDITSDDPDEATVTVALSGNGTTTPVPDINASPNTLNFGQVQRLTCASRTTQMQNTGSATLNITNITRAFLTSTEFTWTPNTFTLAPGASATLTVTYCPVDTGLEIGGLNVASNDPDENPYNISLFGEGTAPPLSETDIAVELTWDKNDTDVDTHFIRPGATFDSVPGDCYYVNLSPDWGVAGDATDDPYLDYDDIDGLGPENLNFAKPMTGAYRLAIYYYSDHGNGGTTATVKVYLNGTLAWQGSKAITNHQRWDVMDINWNAPGDSGTIAMVDTVTQMFTFAPDQK